jgi:hypothetical protein
LNIEQFVFDNSTKPNLKPLEQFGHALDIVGKPSTSRVLWR